jgi:hypothetical protein
VDETLEAVLRLVEEGRLSPEDAATILAAHDEASDGSRSGATTDRRPSTAQRDGPRSIRIEVTDGGRNVVNLRLPASIGELALLRIPGLSEDDTARIREALRAGLVGDLVRAMDDEGSGVRISVE